MSAPMDQLNLSSELPESADPEAAALADFALTEVRRILQLEQAPDPAELRETQAQALRAKRQQTISEARKRGKALRIERAKVREATLRIDPTMVPLSDREERFAQLYVRDLSIARAARAAGYSEKTAGVRGNHLLKRPNIQARIRVLQAERLQRIHAEQDDALRELLAIVRAETRHYTFNGGKLDLASDAPPDAFRAVKRFHYRPRETSRGILFSIELELHDRAQALGLLLRHFDAAQGLLGALPTREELCRLLRNALDDLKAGAAVCELSILKQDETRPARATRRARKTVSQPATLSSINPSQPEDGKQWRKLEISPASAPDVVPDVVPNAADSTLTLADGRLTNVNLSRTREGNEPVSEVELVSEPVASEPAAVKESFSDPMDPPQPHGPSEKPIDLMDGRHPMDALPPEPADRPVDEPTYRPPAAPDQAATDQATHECGQPMNGSADAPADAPADDLDSDELSL